MPHFKFPVSINGLRPVERYDYGILPVVGGFFERLPSCTAAAEKSRQGH